MKSSWRGALEFLAGTIARRVQALSVLSASDLPGPLNGGHIPIAVGVPPRCAEELFAHFVHYGAWIELDHPRRAKLLEGMTVFMHVLGNLKSADEFVHLTELLAWLDLRFGVEP